MEAIHAFFSPFLSFLASCADDIVQIRHVLLPTLPRFFKVVYFVMELLDANGYEVRSLVGFLHLIVCFDKIPLTVAAKCPLLIFRRRCWMADQTDADAHADHGARAIGRPGRRSVL